jgi:Zn finger protein HypA/HybF involved in hydrogenase expression
LVLVTCGFVGVMLLVVVMSARVEFRKITPLAFRCRHCKTEFQQAPHRVFPRVCPSCKATDWAAERRG